MHVNNPSGIKRADGGWAMLYTQLPKTPAPPLNKPGLSTSVDGVVFDPAAGGEDQLVSVTGCGPPTGREVCLNI